MCFLFQFIIRRSLFLGSKGGAAQNGRKSFFWCFKSFFEFLSFLVFLVLEWRARSSIEIIFSQSTLEQRRKHRGIRPHRARSPKARREFAFREEVLDLIAKRTLVQGRG